MNHSSRPTASSDCWPGRIAIEVNGLPTSADVDIDGILLVDKPEGISSAKALARARQLLGRPKAGHLGTLDPMATGLLPLCIGAGTKIARYLSGDDKAYHGSIRLGLRTDTLDITGRTLDSTTAPDPNELDHPELARRFTGKFEQVPPVFSAIKEGGVPLYKLARRGRTEEPEARSVTIHSLRFWAAGPGLLGFEMDCSKGTYVRSLARALGEQIGCGAALAELRRTRFGPFSVAESVSLDDMERGLPEALAPALVPLLAALRDRAGMATVPVSEELALALRQGRQEPMAALEFPAGTGERACLVLDEQPVAVVHQSGQSWQLERVFAAQQRPTPGP